MSIKCRVIEGGYCEITQGYKAGVHNGIDIVGPGYTLAWEVAHSDGVVVATRNDCNWFESGSYGNYVKIRHDDGYYTLYAHGAYNTVQVSVGQRVSRGQRLMYMGNTGESYGGHLHWEVRNPSDVRIDPTSYLDKDLPSSNRDVNVYYRVRTKKHGWLPEVKNLEDYAGCENSPITDIAIKVDKGSVKYRVHCKEIKNTNGKVTRGAEWLPYVTGYNIDDFNNGYAGDGRQIDAVEVYYYTPSDIRPYKKAKYRVNNYPWQYDNETSNGQDGYAGEFGKNVIKFQIVIE